MADELQNRQEFLESDDFRRNAAIIITEMLNVSNNLPEHRTVLMDEVLYLTGVMCGLSVGLNTKYFLCNIKNSLSLFEQILHSIFFLGTINKPAYTPKQILDVRYNEIKKLYPKPFDCYSSQLPRRSPFSCVLDMIVCLTGRENEEDIKATLQELILDLREDAQSEQKCLFSSVICISQADQDSVKHYGVSMSTSNKDAKGIMVAVSCCHEWDEYVAGAVMTYFPNRKKNKRKDKTEIDGTIILPESVMCRAFKFRRNADERDMPLEEMLPCKSCATLFSLETTEKQVWPYGNCAEPECLSNLFKNEAQIKDTVKLQKPESWTAEDKEIAKKMVLTSLKNSLKRVKFNQDMIFYTPQKVKKKCCLLCCL